MKNSFLDIMRSRILLMIKGKNVERFLLRLYKHKINIISCKKLSDDYYQITINYAEYDNF